MSHNSGKIAYVYRLTSHDLYGNERRFDPSYRLFTRSASADSIISNQNSVSTSKSWSPGTTFELDCGYNLCISCKNINPRPDLSSEQTMYGRSLSAGPLRLRAWIWLLQYVMKDLVAPLTHYNSLKLWQISLRRTL